MWRLSRARSQGHMITALHGPYGLSVMGTSLKHSLYQTRTYNLGLAAVPTSLLLSSLALDL